MRRKFVSIKATVNVYTLIKLEERQVTDRKVIKNVQKIPAKDLQEAYPGYLICASDTETGVYSMPISEFLSAAVYTADKSADDATDKEE